MSDMTDEAYSLEHTTINAVTPLNSPRAEALVFHATLFLLAVIALVAGFRLPRALARFWKASEWSSGHFLRSGSYRRSSSTFVQSYPDAYPPPKEAASDESHTLYSHAKHAERLNSKGMPLILSYPPHVTSCPRFLRSPLAPLRSRIAPSFSLAQVLVLLFYSCILIYAAFYKSSPFTDPLRTGWVAIAQLPFVFSFASKNNVLGMFLGLGYEKVGLSSGLILHMSHILFSSTFYIAMSDGWSS